METQSPREFAKSLRQLADLLEKLPETGSPQNLGMAYFAVICETHADFRNAARSAGLTMKDRREHVLVYDPRLSLCRHINSNLWLDVSIDKDKVATFIERPSIEKVWYVSENLLADDYVLPERLA